MTTLPVDVLYEDNHLIIVNKPAGILSQPTDIESDSIETRVKAWLKKKYNKPGNVFAGVIHRLDKPVSGILVLAKTSKALSRLNASLRNRDMQKTYWAFVEGIPQKNQGTLIHYLKHGDHCGILSNQNDKDAKLAKLNYQAIKESGKKTLVHIVLETGRYHQIRCQFAAIGHPVVGDLRYGAKKDVGFSLPGNAIALHHKHLTFTHPVTKEMLHIEAPLPAYFS